MTDTDTTAEEGQEQFPQSLSEFASTRPAEQRRLASAFARSLLAESHEWQLPKRPDEWAALFAHWRQKPAGVACRDWMRRS